MNPMYLMPLLLWAGLYWGGMITTIAIFIVVGAVLFVLTFGRWMGILTLALGFCVFWIFNPKAARQAWRDQSR